MICQVIYNIAIADFENIIVQLEKWQPSSHFHNGLTHHVVDRALHAGVVVAELQKIAEEMDPRTEDWFVIIFYTQHFGFGSTKLILKKSIFTFLVLFNLCALDILDWFRCFV